MRSLQDQFEEADSARLRAILAANDCSPSADPGSNGPPHRSVPPALRGRLDEASRTLLRGWAIDDRHPDQPVSLLVLLDGALLGRVVANRFRQDLREAGLGDGRHGFELGFGDGLSPLRAHQIRVLREEDGADLPQSPAIIEAATRLDAVELHRLGDLLLDGLDDNGGLDRRIGFLLEQLDRLLDARAAGANAGAAAWRAARVGPGDAAIGPAPDGRLVALVIDEVMPDETRDAGSNALLSHMRSLLRLGFKVVFRAAERRHAPHLVDALSRHGIDTCAVPFSASVEEVLSRYGDVASVVYLHRGSLGSRYGRLVRHLCPSARLVLSIADLEGLRIGRQAAAEGRDELLPPARRSALRDLDAMAQADIVLTHSSVEAEAIRRALPGKPVRRALWTASTRPVSRRFASRDGVAFLANYAHAPNLDAARRLVDEIMPLVWEHEPEMPCLLAGSRLPHGFGAGDRRVVWVGHVPELQSLFERVRLTVAPLLFGAGVKGKVLESLAAGVPCACSPTAAEGLDLPATLRDLISDDTHGMARQIVRLHRDHALNRRAAEAGLAWTAEALSEQALDQALREAVSGCPRKDAKPSGGIRFDAPPAAN